MTESQLKSILQAFEHVKRKPYMFIAPGLPDIANWLLGFNLACQVLGVTPPEAMVVLEVMKERGWEESTLLPTYKMQQELKPEELIAELLTIQIIAWQRQYAKEDSE